MSIIKSFSVEDCHGQQGDMFYIKHNSDNFSIIDCCLNDDTKENIINEINEMKKDKGISRFISTHPDEDHICGIEDLDNETEIINFYCVENEATKADESDSFNYYCELRDREKTFYVEKGCSRKWMNMSDPNEHGSAGINFLWPITTNTDFKGELTKAKEGTAFNNISPIFTYSLENGVKVMWMGDIEADFVEKIKDKIEWPEVDIVFAPHHGRESGKIPSDVLKKLNPTIVVIGEAPSNNIDYYSGYNTITQNSAKDITFKCETGKVHVYVSSDSYYVGYLNDEVEDDTALGNYIGSFDTKEYW